MLTCLSGMDDRKKKIEIFFQNTSHENQEVKSIWRCAVDSLKHEKQNQNVFHSRSLTQRKGEFCSISRTQIFHSKENYAPTLNRGIKSIYPDEFEQRFLSRLILSFFRWTSAQLITLDIILVEWKQFQDLLVMSKNALHKWSRKLGFCISSTINRCQCVFNLVLILCLKLD